MSKLRCSVLFVMGCDPAALTYDIGHDLKDLSYSLYTETTGIYPSTDVLDDPNNPFALGGLAGEVRWDLQSADHVVAAYYAWATWLTQQPSGEAQYYTAFNLQQIYARGLADSEDLYFVRELAIAGYTAQMVIFPDAVSYDATGTFSFALSPLSFAAIESLGGETPPGWASVTDADGNTVVFQTGGE